MDELQRDELPDLRVAADEQQPEQALAEEADDVRRDHDVLPREPVGPHAAREEEEHLPEDPREEDEPEIGGRTGQVEHRERDRDRHEEVAEGRDETGDEDAPEVPVAKRRGDHFSASYSLRFAASLAMPVRGRGGFADAAVLSRVAEQKALGAPR